MVRASGEQPAAVLANPGCAFLSAEAHPDDGNSLREIYYATAGEAAYGAPSPATDNVDAWVAAAQARLQADRLDMNAEPAVDAASRQFEIAKSLQDKVRKARIYRAVMVRVARLNARCSLH